MKLVKYKGFLWLSVLAGFGIFLVARYYFLGTVDHRLLKSILFCLVIYPLALLFGILLYLVPLKVSVFLARADEIRRLNDGNPFIGACVFWVIGVLYLTGLAFLEIENLSVEPVLFLKAFAFVGVIVLVFLIANGRPRLRFYFSVLLIAIAGFAFFGDHGGAFTGFGQVVAMVGLIFALVLLGSRDVKTYLEEGADRERGRGLDNGFNDEGHF